METNEDEEGSAVTPLLIRVMVPQEYYFVPCQ